MEPKIDNGRRLRNFSKFRMKEIHILHLYVSLVVLSITVRPSGGRLNPKPEHELFSDQLCPDPLVSSETDRETINVPNNTILIKLAEDVPSFDKFLPCNFEVDTPWNNGSQVNITAVNLNAESWNFSSSRKCSEYFKFKHKEEYGDGFEVFCQAWKRAHIGSLIALYAHSMIMDYRWEPKKLAFAIFHSSTGHRIHDETENITMLNYLQIHFSVAIGNDNTICRVQQYYLDQTNEGCPIQYDLHDICGEYNCEDEKIDQTYTEKVSTDHLPDVPEIELPPLDPDLGEHRILTLGTLLSAAVAPIVFSIAIVLAYKWYVNPRLQFRRYTRSNGSEENQPGRIRASSPSCPQSSLELRETWHLSEPRSGSSINLDMEAVSIPALSGVVTSDTILALKPLLPKALTKADMPPSYDEELPPTYSEATVSSALETTGN